MQMGVFYKDSFNSLYVFTIITAEITNVSTSDTGMENSTPSNPKISGSVRAKPTPKTTSRNIDSMVEANALPRACRKMKCF